MGFFFNLVFRKSEFILFIFMMGFLVGGKEFVCVFNDMDFGRKGFKINFGFI